jgi:ATP-dependent Lhr-like helicase
MTAFDTLNEKVRRWVWQQGWDGLKDVQERSIPILLTGQRDLIIMAATAGGKTEAAFLPIVSRLSSEPPATGDGFQAIYVSPMRALINDQFGRMESLCADLDITVTRWHGDVSASVKARARRNPNGIVLITPESLEALLVRRGKEIARLFRGLRYVVIDEMHVFLEDPRGKQLQSILHRIDQAAGATAVRVGLSATLADEAAARAFLRPLQPDRVEVLPPGPGRPPIMLQLRGYVRPSSFRHAPPPSKPAEGDSETQPAQEDPTQAAIASHLFETHRGHRSLIFAGSRGMVETVAARLRDMGEAAGVPEEFFAHHGNLSREYREHAELRMKDSSRPASIVCTTTLELGIDVGEIEAVAQLGLGHTVSGMRQRLGRSGRRTGQPAVMRVYVTESDLTGAPHPLDALRAQTVQCIAMLNLMLQRWNEPPEPRRLHLSTLLHQIMALISQHGGIMPAQAWSDLVASGTFGGINADLFRQLLRRMGEPEVALLEQAGDGTLLPGREGERLLESRDIFSVFLSAEDYKVVAEGGQAIGQVPGNTPFSVGERLMLAGRRWRIVEVDPRRHELSVRPAKGGNPPVFGGELRPPSEGVVQEMRRIWEDLSFPAFLDSNAKALLIEARTSYDRLRLRGTSVARHEGQLLLFPWVGERRQRALLLALIDADLEPVQLGIAIGVAAEKQDTLLETLSRMATGQGCDAAALAELVENKAIEKFDYLLGDQLLALAWARDRIEVEGLPALAGRLRTALAAV